MSDQSPRSAFSRAVKNGWERFLCPFTLVDQDGFHAHNNQTPLGRAENFIFRPENSVVLGITLFDLALRAVLLGGAHPITQSIYAGIVALTFLSNGKTRKEIAKQQAPGPRYFVNTREKGTGFSDEIGQDAFKRLVVSGAVLQHSLPGSVLRATLGFVILGPVGMFAMNTTRFMLMAENLRARKILDGEWAVLDSRPDYKEKAKRQRRMAPAKPAHALTAR